MSKRLINFGMLVCLVALTTNLWAQDETSSKKYKAEYPRYGFWSNWSLGFNFEYQHQLAANDLGMDGFLPTNGNFGTTTLAGLGIDLEKELSYIWDLRIRARAPYLSALNRNRPDWFNPYWAGALLDGDNGHKRTSSYILAPIGYAGIDFKLNLIDLFSGYNPDRKFSLYLYAGGGFAYQNKHCFPDSIRVNFEDTTAFRHDVTRSWYSDLHANMDDSCSYAILNRETVNLESTSGYGKVAVYGNLGIGMSLKMCEHSSLFIESDMNVISDAPAFWRKGVNHHLNYMVTAGWMYHFGPTATDLEIIAQRALLTQENFDAMEDQIAGLEKDLNTSKKAEQRLENRISELEGQVSQLTAANEAARKADHSAEVQKAISQLKDDQLTYYAIPFSVLFPNDQWVVPQDQYRKLQAIAKVLENNPGVNLTLIGFCDYTASHEYNMKLSEKRVKEVKRLLVEKYGVDEDRLAIDWKGKTTAFGDIQYSVNRRVSFYRIIE